MDGWALEIILKQYKEAFTELAILSRTAICCRVTPSQKAQVLSLSVVYLLLYTTVCTTYIIHHWSGVVYLITYANHWYVFCLCCVLYQLGWRGYYEILICRIGIVVLLYQRILYLMP